MKDDLNLHCFLACVSDLVTTDQVRAMQAWRHHFDVTCYDHSIFVSYVAFRLARRWRLDYVAAARAGLLHDLYLYDPHDKTAHPGNQCLDHPRFALRNARALVELTPVEENSIISHMWPLAPRMPKCKVAFVVNLADKICATLEVARVYHAMHVRQVMPA